MSETGYILIAILAVIGVLGWRGLSTIHNVCTTNARFLEKERTHYHQSMERLLAKRDIPLHQNLDLDTIHAQERMSEIGQEATTDRSSRESLNNQPFPPDRNLETVAPLGGR